MPENSSPNPGHTPPPGRLRHAMHRSAAGRAWKRSRELELMHRSMSFAALGFLTLVPLLIVVAAADPANGKGFAEWLSEALGVSPTAQKEVEHLFAQPGRALQTTTTFGLATLAVFGLTFGGAVQTGYERVWDLPPARWHTMWRHIVWLALLIAYLVFSARVTLPNPSTPQAVFRTMAAMIGGVFFFWGSQRLLLGGRIGWADLLPGAVVTVLALLGLRVFSQLVFSPLIASSAVTYGPIGTVLVVQSWLVGVGFVVFGGAVVGRVLDEEFHRVGRRLRRRE